MCYTVKACRHWECFVCVFYFFCYENMHRSETWPICQGNLQLWITETLQRLSRKCTALKLNNICQENLLLWNFTTYVMKTTSSETSQHMTRKSTALKLYLKCQKNMLLWNFKTLIKEMCTQIKTAHFLWELLSTLNICFNCQGNSLLSTNSLFFYHAGRERYETQCQRRGGGAGQQAGAGRGRGS